jgi:hypothetical protein
VPITAKFKLCSCRDRFVGGVICLCGSNGLNSVDIKQMMNNDVTVIMMTCYTYKATYLAHVRLNVPCDTIKFVCLTFSSVNLFNCAFPPVFKFVEFHLITALYQVFASCWWCMLSLICRRL